MRLVLLLTLAVLAVALSASAQSVNWVQYIKPTDRWNYAQGVCTFGDYLAVVGDTYLHEFIALLNKTTGEVAKTWSGRFGLLTNCLSVGDKLYVVGGGILEMDNSSYLRFGKIYIFDKGLNAVKEIEVDWSLYAVASDGEYLYVAGVMDKDVDNDSDYERIWRIEKRTLDLDLVAYREYWGEGDKAYDHLYLGDIAVNQAFGELWAVGRGFYNKTQYLLVVIFDRKLAVKKTVEYSEESEVSYLNDLIGVCFNEDGNAYVLGEDGFAKFDKGGNVLASKILVNLDKIACVGSRVYVFGGWHVNGYWRHVLYVFDEDLNLLSELILSKGVEADSWFSNDKPAFDGRNLYVAGWDEALGGYNTRIVVYSISLPTVRVVVQVVDGFGQPRDWPVEVEGVASGMGQVATEVVEGVRYVARATGLGFTNTTAFTAQSPQMVVTIKIPTAKLAAQVVDGFGNVRQDWPVEVVGVAAGRGTIGPVEVLAGQYTVKTSVFGKEFTQTVTLRTGEAQTVAVHVPTARLSVEVVDEGGTPVGQVESVEVDGPTSFTSTTPPRDVEVLAGQYTVRVMAFGREATAAVSISPGEVKTVKVIVPAAQSQPTATQAASPTTPEAVTTPTATQTATMPQTESIQPATAPPPPTPPPPPTDFLVVGVAVAVAAVAGVLATARLRGRSAEARRAQSTTQTVTLPRVGETGAVGDFCLEYPGGVIPLTAYTVVGRGDFSGLPERVLAMIEERHFAVYYRDGVWWVEDLGSRHGTYLNGVRVKKERLREGDVISPGAAVAAVFKRCETTRRVVPMEDDTQLWK